MLPGSPLHCSGLAAGLAVVDAVRPLLDGHLAENHEIGLALAERCFRGGPKNWREFWWRFCPTGRSSLGIGLNVNNSVAAAPAELQSVATTLFDLTQTRHDRISILISLLNHLKRYLDLIRSSPEKLAAAADAVCLQKNQRLHLQWGRRFIPACAAESMAPARFCWKRTKDCRAFPSGVLLKSIVEM